MEGLMSQPLILQSQALGFPIGQRWIAFQNDAGRLSPKCVRFQVEAFLISEIGVQAHSERPFNESYGMQGPPARPSVRLPARPPAVGYLSLIYNWFDETAAHITEPGVLPDFPLTPHSAAGK